MEGVGIEIVRQWWTQPIPPTAVTPTEVGAQYAQRGELSPPAAATIASIHRVLDPVFRRDDD
jgi:hypothetical protein